MGGLSLDINGDIDISPSGGIATADGDVYSRQRVIRRLVTNMRVVQDDGSILDPDYVYDTTYGTRLGRAVGAAPTQSDLDLIEQSVRTALAAEDTVLQSSPPVINFTIVSDGIRVAISYTAAQSGQPVAIALLVPS